MATVESSVRPVMVTGGDGSSPDRPDFQGLVHRSQAQDVKTIRDVYGGTRALRANKSLYLPQFPLEDNKAYKDRSDQSVSFNVVRRTVKGLNGMVFRKDPILGDDVPKEIAGEEGLPGHIENIDLAGRKLNVFAKDVFDWALLDGHSFIFVDMQPIDPDVRTLAQERDAGLRPYWIAIPKQDILSFRTETIGGRPILTQLAYHTRVTVPIGPFGERLVERIRVYRLEPGPTTAFVSFEIFEKRKMQSMGGNPWVSIQRGIMTINEIPLVPVYANREGHFKSTPPLLDLAFENIRHFQQRSDRDNTLHVAGVTIPVFTGVNTEQAIGIGADLAIKLKNVESKAFYLEPKGFGLRESREELSATERRMAVLGLSMLASEQRKAETAEAKKIDKAESDSQLAAAAGGLEDALEEALRLHSRWMRIEGGGGSVTVNTDFMDQPLTPEMVSAISDMVAKGQLSLDTMWDVLMKGEILSEDFDPEAEQDRLDALDLEGFILGQPPTDDNEGDLDNG